ncbi:CCC motif membrane protein [Pricia sp. S334]|uniref:CCC motif membrane protein n=1 Tax=Pricia mediterranea TaxID=3076079 RepID=A0ABU3L8P8_9FLAO|nr:CCC motif membrane protein [Pricia sp. S334]MDT7829938.1 CCC motif membrane protein [Pricia sp. S334]
MENRNPVPLPGSSNALTFGILSIVLTLTCCGPFGAIFSFLGLSNAKTAQNVFLKSTGQYTGIENAKTGKILSYIGLAVAGIYLILGIIYFGVIAAIVASSISEGGGF